MGSTVGEDYAIDHWSGEQEFDSYIGVPFDPTLLKQLIKKIKNYNRENPSFEGRKKRLKEAVHSGQIEELPKYINLPHYESIFSALYWRVFEQQEVDDLVYKH